jgi:hypothetical protein
MPIAEQPSQRIRRKKWQKPWQPGDPVPESVRSELNLPAIKRKPRAEPKLPEVPKRPVGARDLFADPDQRAAEVEYAFQLMRARGDLEVIRGDIQITQTSMDRNFTQGEYEAICWFAKFHAIVIGGKLAPEAAGDFEARAEYAHVFERLPESFAVVLDWVAAVKYPQLFANLNETMPGKVKMAKAMFASVDEHYLRGGMDGFFKAVCQLLAHVRAERQTQLDRQRLIREQYRGNRRIGNENG